jgi:hypothetical protein
MFKSVPASQSSILHPMRYAPCQLSQPSHPLTFLTSILHAMRHALCPMPLLPTSKFLAPSHLRFFHPMRYALCALPVFPTFSSSHLPSFPLFPCNHLLKINACSRSRDSPSAVTRMARLPGTGHSCWQIPQPMHFSGSTYGLWSRIWI